MMTPQEVAGCTFAKAMVGGYNMAAVDDFLDKLTEDYSSLYNENAALKSKLKVSVDKLKEYREIEDAMRSALLTSQKMANSIVAEAEQRRDAIIADAAGGAKRRLEEIHQELAEAKQRLAEAKVEVDRQLEVEAKRLAAGQEQLRSFIRNVTAVCNGQLALLEQLPELPVVEEVPVAPAEEAAGVEEPAEAVQEAPAPTDDIAKELADVFGSLDQPAQPAEEPAENVADLFTRDAPEDSGGDDGDEDDEDGAATRIMNLDDLQFGRNYTKS